MLVRKGFVVLRVIAFAFVVCSICAGVCLGASPDEPVTVHIFYDSVIHFTPDDATRYDTDLVKARDNGRMAVRTVDLGTPPAPARIVAHVAVRPVPKDELEMVDRWDRAGDIRLRLPGMDDVEVVKFMTAYGGPSSYDVDVTDLAPLLRGPCTFVAWIDTWVSPAWHVDFSLEFRPVADAGAPDWADGLFFEESMEEAEVRGGPMARTVTIPDGVHRVVMNYFTSGHCTDGRDADEFESKDNVITVDGVEVYRFKPWRDDCRQFRAANPYCRRWTDGSWSSDYDRSGWCPSDKVDPVEIDLTRVLTPGPHTVGFRVQNIRPRGDDGNLGYWRISAHLVGWKE